MVGNSGCNHICSAQSDCAMGAFKTINTRFQSTHVVQPNGKIKMFDSITNNIQSLFLSLHTLGVDIRFLNNTD